MAKDKIGLEVELITKNFEANAAKVEKSLDRLDKQLDDVAATTARNNDKMAASFDKTARSAISFRDVVGAIGLYQVTSQFTDFFKSAYQGASAFEALALGNKALAESIGTTTDVLAQATKTAALGMIDDATAIRQANEAIMTGAVTSQAEMEEMTRIAVSLGITMGKTAAESIDIFTTALGKGQPRLLYQLGIMVDAEAAQKAYAASLGRAAGQLTDLEQKEAVRNAALDKGRQLMQQMGDVSGLQTVKMQQLTTSWDEFGDAMGRFVIKAEQSSDALGWLKRRIDDLTAGAEAWQNMGNLAAIASLQEGMDKAMEALRTTGDMTGLMTAFAQGQFWDELQQALARSSDGFEEYGEVVAQVTGDLQSEMSPGLHRALVEQLTITEEEFNALRESSAALSPELLKQASAWRELEKSVATQAIEDAADQMRHWQDLQTFGIEVNRWYEAGLQGVAGAWGNVSKASQDALDKELAAQRERDKAWVTAQTSLANYVQGMQQAKTDLSTTLSVTGTGAGDAEKTANEDRIQNNIDLKSRLIEIEKDRAAKIKWVHDGDHARTKEQNAADLQYWQDYYDQLATDAILSYEGKNVKIKQIEDQAQADAQKRAGEAKAAYDKQVLELTTSAGLSVIASQGKLGEFTGGAATDVADALLKIQTGVIAMTPDRTQALADAVNSVNISAANATTTMADNEAALKDASDGIVNDVTTIAGVTSDAIDQIKTVPPAPLAGAEALGVAGTGVTQAVSDAEEVKEKWFTIVDGVFAKSDELTTTLPSKWQTSIDEVNAAMDQGTETLKNKWDTNIEEMLKSVTDVKWDDEVAKPIVEGMAKGLTDNKAITNQAMTDLVNAMIAAARAAAGVSSPSTEGEYIGQEIAHGLIVGMEQSGWQVEDAATDTIQQAFKGFLAASLEPNTRTMVLDHFMDILEDITVGAGDTYQSVMMRAIDQLTSGMSDTIKAMLRAKLPALWAALGEMAGQTVVSPLAQAEGLFKAGGLMGSLGTTAINLQRTASTNRIKQLQDQLMLLDDQGTALAEQERILAEIEAERTKITDLEATQLELQKQQSQLQFLQQQAQLLELLRTYNINPAQVLGGLQLGPNADLQAVAEAMSRAMELILQRANTALGFQHGGAFTVPPGYPNDSYRVGLTSGERVVITPQGFAHAGDVNVNISGVTISNGMQLAEFRAEVVQSVRGALRVG